MNWYKMIKFYDVKSHLDSIKFYKPVFYLIYRGWWIRYFAFSFIHSRTNQFYKILSRGWVTSCWNYSSHGITCFTFVGLYDSIKAWIRKTKFEINTSLKHLVLTKSSKMFLVFTHSAGVWSVLDTTDSPICSSKLLPLL